MLRRWLDILLYAVVGAITFEIALPIGSHLSARYPFPAWYASWFVTGVVVLAAMLIACIPIRFRRSHWRFFLPYPPLWVAVAVAIILAALCGHLPTPLRPQNEVVDWQKPHVFAWLLITFFLAILPRYWLLRQSNSENLQLAEEAPLKEPDPDGWEALQRWMATEHPVPSTGPDLFGHQPIAKRIARTLLSEPPRQNIALLGPFGSGKSSILNWVREELKKSKSEFIIPVPLNCWAIPKPEDAPLFALQQIIDALGKYVDVQAFRGLPTAYQRLIAAEPSGILHKLFSLDGAADPLTKLRPLESVLAALKARIVLFIEDAERAGHRFEVRHFERLLWTLRDVKNISFVLAIDPKKARFDYAKLCDVIELIPRIDPECTLRILRLAYHHWIHDIPFIDPRSGARRMHAMRLTEMAGDSLEFERRIANDEPGYAVSEMISSPRAVKQLIRRVDRVWNNLRGEVDLDDLIALAALRDGDRKVFDFLVNNIDAARQTPRPLTPRPDIVKREWEKLVSSRRHPKAVKTLVDVLAILQLRENNQGFDSQSAGHSAPDYFRRILAEQIAPNELRDQTVLREMDQWKQSRGDLMISNLLGASDGNDDYVNRWEHFASRLTESELLKITEDLIDRTLQAEGSAASMESQGLEVVWRCLPQAWGQRAGEDWLAKAMPHSLNFANELFRSWATPHGGIVSSGERKIARRAVFNAARNSYVDAATLLRALNAKHKNALDLLIAPLPDGDASDTIGLTEWHWLGPCVVEAARQNPDIMVPSVARMVCDRNCSLPLEPDPERLDEIYKLDRDRMSAIFGDQAEPMLTLLARYSGDDAYAIAASRAAKNWLAGQGSAAV